mgnify:CR=1 FL=1
MVNRMRRVLVCAVIATSSLATVASSTQASTCAATYTVKSGDSWWRIAEKNNTNLRKVLTLNNAKKTTKLLVGKTVCVLDRQCCIISIHLLNHDYYMQYHPKLMKFVLLEKYLMNN